MELSIPLLGAVFPVGGIFNNKNDFILRQFLSVSSEGFVTGKSYFGTISKQSDCHVFFSEEEFDSIYWVTTNDIGKPRECLFSITFSLQWSLL